jgi:hypothetical protein
MAGTDPTPGRHAVLETVAGGSPSAVASELNASEGFCCGGPGEHRGGLALRLIGHGPWEVSRHDTLGLKRGGVDDVDRSGQRVKPIGMAVGPRCAVPRSLIARRRVELAAAGLDSPLDKPVAGDAMKS